MSSAKFVTIDKLKHYHDTMVEEVLTPAVTGVTEAAASAYGHTISVSGSTLSLLDASGTTLSSTTLPGSSVFVGSGSTAASGLVPAPSTTAGTTKYLREDGTWQVPPDNNTTYSNFVGSGSSAAAGLVPAPPSTAGTTKFLREDGQWAVASADITEFTTSEIDALFA